MSRDLYAPAPLAPERRISRRSLLRGQLLRWADAGAARAATLPGAGGADDAPGAREDVRLAEAQVGSADAATRARALARIRDGWERERHDPLLRAIEPVGELLAELAGVQAGMRVLDAGAGDGNVARAAIRRGAEVAACDLAPAMVALGCERCPAVAWQIADVQQLPYPDGSFDAVLSAFGAALAPHPLRAARELARVTRPGGTVVLAAWTPRGLPGALEAHVEQVAPWPDGIPPSTSWGRQAVARARLAPFLDELELRLRTVTLRFPSPAALLDALIAPLALDATQRRALRPAFDRLLAACNNDADGGVEVDARYLVASGRRRGDVSPIA